MEAFLVKHKDTIIENAIFSFLPMVSLLVARSGLKCWLNFEIFITIAQALALVLNPVKIFEGYVS